MGVSIGRGVLMPWNGSGVISGLGLGLLNVREGIERAMSCVNFIAILE
jgi:hypothetical protein